MRCPSCSKFVPFSDEPEIEAEDPTLEVLDVLRVESAEGDSFEVSLRLATTVAIKRTCGECGDELSEASVEAEATAEHTCPPSESDADDPEEQLADDSAWEVEADDATSTERSEVEVTVRRGKPHKGRSPTTFIGFEQQATATCPRCAEGVTFALAGEERASGFESLV